MAEAFLFHRAGRDPVGPRTQLAAAGAQPDPALEADEEEFSYGIEQDQE